MTTSLAMASAHRIDPPGPAAARDPSKQVLTLGSEVGGPIGRAIEAMTALVLEDVVNGAWDESLRLSRETLRLCDAHGYEEMRWPLWFAQATVAAARGEVTDSARLAARVDSWSARRAMPEVHLYGHYVRGLAAEAQGDFEEAFRQFAVLTVPSDLASARPLAAWACLDFVECALRTGRAPEAAAFVDLVDDGGQNSPRAALLIASARALTAPLESGAVEVALAAIGGDRMPFDVARVKLAHAERLRRCRLVVEARSLLEEASALFQQLGAAPWVRRTEREMRATGAPTQDRAVQSSSGSLTPQEQEIAELAAAGLTNKQIAARVYLSHRTVGAHLYRVFPKLGVSTRAALRDALASGPLTPVGAARS
jgi:ATP/maltotriose-dependent transcriptional regulator MalT